MPEVPLGKDSIRTYDLPIAFRKQRVSKGNLRAISLLVCDGSLATLNLWTDLANSSTLEDKNGLVKEEPVTDRERFFTSGEVQRLVGVAQHTLTYWDRSAVVHPRGMSAQGRGSRRLYTILDVVQLKVIRRLREAGISLQKIRRTFELMADWPDEPAPLAELEVITDGTQILVRRSDNNLVDVLTGQFVLRLPLADLLTEVRNNVVPPPFIDLGTRPLVTVVGGQLQ